MNAFDKADALWGEPEKQPQPVAGVRTSSHAGNSRASSQVVKQGWTQEQLEAWLLEHGLEVRRGFPVPDDGRMKYVLTQCPFDPNHQAKDAAVFWSPDGLGFKCFHDSCSNKGWKELRELMEPGYQSQWQTRCAARSTIKTDASHRTGMPREFRVLDDDSYVFSIPDLATTLELQRVRWEHNSLVGMLHMRSTFPGARTIQGDTISVAEFNISGPRGRIERAKVLEERIGARFDWRGVMEELCQRTMADQCSAPAAQRLVDIPRAREEDRWLHVAGIRLLTGHPSVFFGDGGSAKSYLALYFAGLIAKQGINVVLFDWELAGGDHRDRFELLFGKAMPPNLWYMRLQSPLAKIQDGLRRFVRDNEIGFAVYDSVGFACGSEPEKAESALSYFAAVRRVCPGGLHIAHRSKYGDSSDKYPFGSIFWHNGARMTWFMEGVEDVTDPSLLSVAMHQRKGNLGAKVQTPIGFDLRFSPESTSVRSTDPTHNPDLAEKMPLWQRMQALLKRGALTAEQIAEATGAKVKAVQSEYNRRKGLFVVVADKVGLRTGVDPDAE